MNINLRAITEEEEKASEGKFRAVMLIDSDAYQIGEGARSLEAAKLLCAVARKSDNDLFSIYDDQVNNCLK